MALLDILTGQQGSSGRVPPLAMALAGLLAYSKLKKPRGEGRPQRTVPASPSGWRTSSSLPPAAVRPPRASSARC